MEKHRHEILYYKTQSFFHYDKKKLHEASVQDLIVSKLEPFRSYLC